MAVQQFPWQDGRWLRRFYKACEIIQNQEPEKLPSFLTEIDKQNTRQDFQVIHLENILDQETIQTTKTYIKNLNNSDFKKTDTLSFGRLLAHNLPFFNKLQEKLVPLVSKAVGEEVEISYNFLSLYENLGICNVHLDAPMAKWTLDVCIDQSYEWPIYISKCHPRPKANEQFDDNWAETILNDSTQEFKPYTLQPGNAIIFSGSAQFHYRDRIYRGNKDDYCHLIFFHFVPKGTKDTCRPKNWAKMLDIPELTLDRLDAKAV